MDIVNSLQSVHENSLEKLVPFASKVENLVIYLRSANATQYLNNAAMMDQLVEKLPLSKRILWNAANIVPYPGLGHLSIWLNGLSRSIARATVVTSKEQATKG